MSFAEALSEPQGATSPEEWSLRNQMLSMAHDLSALYRREQEKTRRLESTLTELEESYGATVRMLAFAIEAKDPHVHSHLERSFAYATALAQHIDPALAGDPAIRHGFLLHDIGKIGIPEAILAKPGPLSPAEFAVMREHPTIGGRIVGPIRALQRAVDVIECHHERWDGGGYPRGLRGEEIPLAARIFAIVDSFDAMTSDRPYRKALTVAEALREIRQAAGSQFDPFCVAAFLDMDWDAPAR